MWLVPGLCSERERAREQAWVLLRRHPEHLLPVPCSGHVLNAAIRIQCHVHSKKIIGSLGHKICERCGVGLLLHLTLACHVRWAEAVGTWV